MESKRGYVLQKATLTSGVLSSIRTDLTVAPLANPSAPGTPTSFPVFLEDDVEMRVPRFYGQQKFGRDPSPTFPCDDAELASTIRLKTELDQPVVVEKTLRSLRDVGGAVVCLPCGFGKTTVALYVASALGVKTLVIVHKSILADQWRERIAQFLPASTVGKIQGKTADVRHDIVIATIQSLAMRDYPPETFEGFGLTIIDECHHAPAAVFSRVFFRIGATRFTLGLSATPTRRDGLTPVLHHFVGPFSYEKTQRTEAGVSVDIVRYRHALFDAPPPVLYNGKANVSKMVTQTTEISERTRMIADKISDVSKTRRTIVLTDRRAHCADIVALVPGSALYVGGMKPADRAVAEKAHVIVSTFALANEGLDIPGLSAIILASPKSDVVQSVGRVMRSGGGSDALVVDVSDEWGLFQGQAKKRRAYYASCGFKINFC